MVQYTKLLLDLFLTVPLNSTALTFTCLCLESISDSNQRTFYSEEKTVPTAVRDGWGMTDPLAASGEGSLAAKRKKSQVCKQRHAVARFATFRFAKLGSVRSVVCWKLESNGSVQRRWHKIQRSDLFCNPRRIIPPVAHNKKTTTQVRSFEIACLSLVLSGGFCQP